MNAKEIIKTVPAGLQAEVMELFEDVREYAEGSRAESTQAAYEGAWDRFECWAAERGLSSLPAAPETVALYLGWLVRKGYKKADGSPADYSAATLDQVIISINDHHRQLADETGEIGTIRPASHPGVRRVMEGIRRKIGVKQDKKKPLRTDQIRAWVETLDLTDPTDVRDRAIVLVGFAGALRRSEIVALDLADLEFTKAGLTVTLRRSKTNQKGELEQVGIKYGEHPETEPIRALRVWLDLAKIKEGPVFRRIRSGRYYQNKITAERISAKWVSVIVKRICETLGLSEFECRDYSGHSLRAGHITEATANGAGEAVTMRQSRHKSTDVFRGYDRPGSLFETNSSAFLGL